MEPRSDLPPQLPVLRREVERPGSGGHGLLPVVVLAAAMASTLAAAALAMTVGPRRGCPRSGHVAMPAATTFDRPAPPARRSYRYVVTAPRAVTAPLAAPVARDPACAPPVFHSRGDIQEWTYETCASAPMPRHFVFSAP